MAHIRYAPVFYQILIFTGAIGIYFSFPFSNTNREHRLPIWPMIAWISALILLSLLRMMIGFDPDYAAMASILMLSTLTMIATWLVGIRLHPTSETSNRATLVLLLIFATACCSVIADPYIDIRAMIDPSIIGTYERSRAGGVFLQPNQAAISLALLYAVTLPRVGPKIAIACTATVLLGIFLTFSRSGQIVVTLIIAISLIRGYLPRATLGLLAGTAALLLTGSFFQNQIVDAFGIDQGSGFMRLTDASRFYSVDALASDVRASLVDSALTDFSTAPWAGRGFGYSWKWADNQFVEAGTHNIYLRYMLEYGALGALIWPLFLLAAFYMRNQTLDKIWCMGICICGLIIGLFSHNIPEQGSILVVMVAALTLPVPQRSFVEHRAI